MAKDISMFFKERDSLWRIEAVIHDGQWYLFNKWKTRAKVKADELQKYIDEKVKDNTLIVAESERGTSYRVSGDTILKWYSKQEGIDIEDNIVPRQYPPRLHNNKTETELFIECERRRVGTVTFFAFDNDILNRVKRVLDGVAKIRTDKNGASRAYGLSYKYIKNLLCRHFSKEEINKMELKTRRGLLVRELSDLEDSFLEYLSEFYLKYSDNAIKGSMSTIEIYIKGKDELESQIYEWLLLAIKKYDETKNIPFSGYLTNVLRHWPYDLPDLHLGKDLSSFQRQKSKAINTLKKEKGDDITENLNLKEVADIMGISLKKFLEYENMNKIWLDEKNANGLVWENSFNEKRGTIYGKKEDEIKRDVDKLNSISKCVILSALKTSDFDTAYTIINNLDLSNPDFSELRNMNEDFVKEFAKELSK